MTSLSILITSPFIVLWSFLSLAVRESLEVSSKCLYKELQVIGDRLQTVRIWVVKVWEFLLLVLAPPPPPTMLSILLSLELK